MKRFWKTTKQHKFKLTSFKELGDHVTISRTQRYSCKNLNKDYQLQHLFLFLYNTAIKQTS